MEDLLEGTSQEHSQADAARKWGRRQLRPHRTCRARRTRVSRAPRPRQRALLPRHLWVHRTPKPDLHGKPPDSASRPKLSPIRLGQRLSTRVATEAHSIDTVNESWRIRHGLDVENGTVAVRVGRCPWLTFGDCRAGRRDACALWPQGGDVSLGSSHRSAGRHRLVFKRPRASDFASVDSSHGAAESQHGPCSGRRRRDGSATPPPAVVRTSHGAGIGGQWIGEAR